MMLTVNALVFVTITKQFSLCTLPLEEQQYDITSFGETYPECHLNRPVG